MNLRRPYKIDIPNHCPQKWEGMQGSGDSKDCLTCKRKVYDFTAKTDLQIHEFLRSSKEERICGRFSSSQLNRPLNITPSFFSRSIAFLLPTIFIAGMHGAKAINVKHEKGEVSNTQLVITQNSVRISGRIVDVETKEPLMFVNVFIRGTKTGVSTDEHGRFELIVDSEVLSSHDSLVCTFIGYEEKTIKIDRSALSNLVIEMKSTVVFIGQIIIEKEPLLRRVFKRRNKPTNYG